MKESEIKALVAEGAAIHAELEACKEKEKRLGEIKETLRELAGKTDAEFFGTDGSIAVIKQTKEALCRTVPAELEKQAVKVAGPFLHDLFCLSPVKTFTMQALKLLPKKPALALIELLTVPATARVSFIHAK